MIKAASLVIVLTLGNYSSIAQRNNDSVVIVNVGIDRVKERHEVLKLFADSINTYSGGVLPEFLFDECFDFQRNLWDGFHLPSSLRWKVLIEVKNKDALKKILSTHDKRLKRKCRFDISMNPEIVIPMNNKSFFQLIRKRYKELS